MDAWDLGPIAASLHHETGWHHSEGLGKDQSSKSGKGRLPSCHQTPRNIAPSNRNPLLSCPLRCLPVSLPFAKWNANCRVIILIKHELDGYWQFEAMQFGNCFFCQMTGHRLALLRWYFQNVDVSSQRLHSQILWYHCLPHTTASLSPPLSSISGSSAAQLAMIPSKKNLPWPSLRGGQAVLSP